VKRQLTKEGIAFEALDNGVLSCENPKRLQQLCDSLDSAKIDAVFRKWLARLPHPFPPETQAAGYRYDLSILQAEFSLTQVLDFPRTGRQFPSTSLRTGFEEVIRENLDLGRPDRVQLIFARREIGFTANRRLLDVQTLSHDAAIGADRFQSVIRPTVQDGQRASALPFGEPRALALLHALCLFVLLPTGFANADLRVLVAALLNQDPARYSTGRMTYDLRRLRLHGLIRRQPHSHRYRVTDDGLRIALFFTRGHARFFRTGLALDGPLPSGSAPRVLVQASQVIDRFLEEAKLAA
jgi:hypothetical protein